MTPVIIYGPIPMTTATKFKPNPEFMLLGDDGEPVDPRQFLAGTTPPPEARPEPQQPEAPVAPPAPKKRGRPAKAKDGMPAEPKDCVPSVPEAAAKKAGRPARAPLPPGVSRWSVRLNCPTPLAHAELEVEAATEEEAKRKFCDANGISGSGHMWQLTRID